MKFMMIVKATANSEQGLMPNEEMFLEMGRYNEELEKAGVLRDLNGLQPSSKGARLILEGDKRRVVDGPFTEAKELIAGYWVIEVASREEALDWLQKVPHPHPGTDTNVELRQVFELSDFENLPDEVRQAEERMQAGRG